MLTKTDELFQRGRHGTLGRRGQPGTVISHSMVGASDDYLQRLEEARKRDHRRIPRSLHASADGPMLVRGAADPAAPGRQGTVWYR